MLEIRSRSVPRSDEPSVALKTKASIPLIANILANTKAREIVCSKAIYETIPKKALLALGEMGVSVRLVKLHRGRPKKHSKQARHLVIKLLSYGGTHKKVSEQLGIPLRTVYYIEENFPHRK